MAGGADQDLPLQLPVARFLAQIPGAQSGKTTAEPQHHAPTIVRTVPENASQAVPIPCETDLHWRWIFFGISISADSFDDSVFRAAIHAQPDETRWILREPDVEGCRTTADLVRPELEVQDTEKSDVEHPMFFIDIRTVRGGDSTPSEKSVRYGDFLRAMASACPDRLHITYITFVGLAFPRPAKWRLGLLTDPPDLGEAGSALGRMTLTGMRMSFEQSPVGLVEASLDPGPPGEDHRVSLLFTQTIPLNEIMGMYVKSLRQAEKLASVFIRHDKEASTGD